MQSELPYTFPSIDLTHAAQEFAAEVAGTAERKKKTIPSPPGLQTFLLYVRAQGYVPLHQVSGAITVQTVLGDARLTAEGHKYNLPRGTVMSLGAGVPHDVFASTESVLLVTHAPQS